MQADWFKDSNPSKRVGAPAPHPTWPLHGSTFAWRLYPFHHMHAQPCCSSNFFYVLLSHPRETLHRMSDYSKLYRVIRYSFATVQSREFAVQRYLASLFRTNTERKSRGGGRMVNEIISKGSLHATIENCVTFSLHLWSKRGRVVQLCTGHMEVSMPCTHPRYIACRGENCVQKKQGR